MSIWTFFNLRTTTCQGSRCGGLKPSLPGSAVRRVGPSAVEPNAPKMKILEGPIFPWLGIKLRQQCGENKISEKNIWGSLEPLPPQCSPQKVNKSSRWEAPGKWTRMWLAAEQMSPPTESTADPSRGEPRHLPFQPPGGRPQHKRKRDTPASLPFTLFLVDNGWKCSGLHLWCGSSSLCWETFDGSRRPHKRGTRSAAWRGAGKGETAPWRLLIRSHLSYGARPLILIGMSASARQRRLLCYHSKCARAINLNK